MNKKKVLTLVFSTAVLTAGTVTTFKSNLMPQFADECEHVGYHYSALKATTANNGHKEFWACCKCGQAFGSVQPGEFEDNLEENMIGGVPEAFVLPKYVEASSIPFGGNATQSDDIYTEGGYLKAYTVAGGNGVYNSPKALPAIDLNDYSEIEFSIKTNGDYYWEFLANGSAKFSGKSTSWTTIKFVRENEKKYQPYVNGVWQSFNIPVSDFCYLSDYSLKLSSSSSALFTFTEVKGISRENSNKSLVSYKVLKDYNYDETNGYTSYAASGFKNVGLIDLSLRHFKALCFEFKTAQPSGKYVDIHDGTKTDVEVSNLIPHVAKIFKNENGKFNTQIDNVVTHTDLESTSLSKFNFFTNSENEFEVYPLYGAKDSTVVYDELGCFATSGKTTSTNTFDGPDYRTNNTHDTLALADIDLTEYNYGYIEIKPSDAVNFYIGETWKISVRKGTATSIGLLFFNRVSETDWSLSYLFLDAAGSCQVTISNLNQLSMKDYGTMYYSQLYLAK